VCGCAGRSIINIQNIIINARNVSTLPGTAAAHESDNDLPVFDSNDEVFASGLPVGSKYCTLINGNFSSLHLVLTGVFLQKEFSLYYMLII